MNQTSSFDLTEQLSYIHKMQGLIQDRAAELGRPLRAFAHTYGCQQNVADTQRICGMLADMGYEMVDNAKSADIVVINSCAVREYAEAKILSHIGELSHVKKANPEAIIAICGCMVQQEHMTEKIKRTYPFVDMVFGTHALTQFPHLLYRVFSEKGRVFDISGDPKGEIAEGLPVLRDGKVRAWLSIMYGCNNFCSYCIVPYVRGRERSRSPEDILAELKALVAEGYSEITLLGQNVNSYGKDLENPLSFSALLRLLNDVEGDFYLRFMTSHPKDASYELFDTMAACDKVAKQLHLPFQSGSDRILKEMNRGYTSGEYMEKINYALEKMPTLVISADVIVGFPTETEADFEDTYRLVDTLRFHTLYTFLYSKRSGTPAALLEDSATKEDKQRRFERLLQRQNQIALERNRSYEGQLITVILEGVSKNPDYPYAARSEGGLLVQIKTENRKDGDKITARVVKGTMRTILAEEVS